MPPFGNLTDVVVFGFSDQGTAVACGALFCGEQKVSAGPFACAEVLDPVRAETKILIAQAVLVPASGAPSTQTYWVTERVQEHTDGGPTDSTKVYTLNIKVDPAPDGGACN